ncbi:MAG: hypothetical protein NVSMB30_19940 [Hymenobacter sp.]
MAGHQRLGRAAHPAATDAYLARAGLNQPGYYLQQGAFAGPGFAGQRQLLVRKLGKADVL